VTLSAAELHSGIDNVVEKARKYLQEKAKNIK
jgi:hypothetical protein